MAEAAVLHKILHIKVQEKTDAQLDKQHAAETFESIATRLYQELKMKEKAESDFEETMFSNMTITKMKDQSLYISRLNEQIIQLQRQVQIARSKMEEKQAILTEAHIEVKKIEKLIEIREQEQQQLALKQEMQFMDEISIRQYANAKIN